MATKPAPPKPVATISDIKPQARQIQQAVASLQAVLLGVELVEHFKQHPDVVQVILGQTDTSRSRRLVLNGLAEALSSQVLPKRDQLLERQQDWLEPGDLIVGWAGELIESPTSPHPSARIVTSVEDDGYKWRYADDEESISRAPVALDPWFQHIGWEQIEGGEDAVGTIDAVQQEELAILSTKLEYFQSHAYKAE